MESRSRPHGGRRRSTECSVKRRRQLRGGSEGEDGELGGAKQRDTYLPRPAPAAQR
jgi:hypothetical protein